MFSSLKLWKCSASCLVKPRFKNIYLSGLQYTERSSAVSSYFMGTRNLYSDESLGMDRFRRSRFQMSDKIGNVKETFNTRMEKYMDVSEENTIFTDDLKTGIMIASNDAELATTMRMAKRYQMRSGSVQYSSFNFGTLAMRLFFYLGKPDEAYQTYTDPDMKGFWDHYKTRQILFDLLLKHEQYDRVKELMTAEYDNRQPGDRHPVALVMITAAACYKQDTPEACDFLNNFFGRCEEDGFQLRSRALGFLLALNISQGREEHAIERLKGRHFHTFGQIPINLKMMALNKLERYKDMLELLEHIVKQNSESSSPEEDQYHGQEKRWTPTHVSLLSDIYEQTETRFKDASPEEQLAFSKVQKSLEECNGIDKNMGLSTWLMKDIMVGLRNQEGPRHRFNAEGGGFEGYQQGNDNYRQGDRYNRQDDRYNRQGDDNYRRADRYHEDDRYNRQGDRDNRQGDRDNRQGDRDNRQGDRYNRQNDRNNRQDDRYGRQDNRSRSQLSQNFDEQD